MRTVIAKLTCRYVAIVTSAALLVGFQLAQAADAGADEFRGALAYAPQTDALYRSDGQALQRSEDGGKQWTKVPLPQSAKGGEVKAIAVSPAGQGTLYVAPRGVGVLRSVDAGQSWVSVGQGLPSDDVIALAAHSSSANTVYAAVAGQGIYRSEDRGEHWRNVDKGPKAQIRQFIHSGLEGSMQTGWLFAATDKGVYRAMDCFCGFRKAGNLPEPVAAVVYDPKQPKELYAAADKQVFASADGGVEWQPLGSPGAAVRALAYSRSGVLYALLADARVVRSADKGRRWE